MEFIKKLLEIQHNVFFRLFPNLMSNMTNLEKEVLKKTCEDLAIDDITDDEIEQLLELQHDWELHSREADKNSMLNKMERIILKEDK